MRKFIGTRKTNARRSETNGKGGEIDPGDPTVSAPNAAPPTEGTANPPLSPSSPPLPSLAVSPPVSPPSVPPLASPESSPLARPEPPSLSEPSPPSVEPSSSPLVRPMYWSVTVIGNAAVRFSSAAISRSLCALTASRNSAAAASPFRVSLARTATVSIDPLCLPSVKHDKVGRVAERGAPERDRCE